MPTDATIDSLLVWLRFLMLPVDYYTAEWIERAGNKILLTIKLNRTMLLASRGKPAKVCVMVDLRKPLKAGYKLRGVMQRI